jgi:hypothetical protein
VYGDQFVERDGLSTSDLDEGWLDVGAQRVGAPAVRAHPGPWILGSPSFCFSFISDLSRSTTSTTP